jgi:hypothetical protein
MNCTIPLRVELRPGYPVYINSIGAYYYIEGLSHSFQFGGQCTTTITGTAKRAKFHAPGNSGSPVTIDSIQLDNPYLPPCPLISEPTDDEPFPHYIGFPNVVLALDPNFLNSRTMLNVATAADFEAAFQAAISYGVVENVGPGGTSAPTSPDGPWAIRTSNEVPSAENQFEKADISDQWDSVQEALLAGDLTPVLNSKLGQIIAEVQKRQPAPDQQDLINYLVLLNDVKARVAPGMSLTGQYRYYSCSHPEPNHQGSPPITVDQTGESPLIGDPTSITGYDDKGAKNVMMFSTTSGAAELIEGTPSYGITVTALDAESSATVKGLQTSDIRAVTFAWHEANANLTLIKTENGKGYGYNLQINPGLEQVYTAALVNAAVSGAGDPVADRFKDKYDEILGEIQTLGKDLEIPPDDSPVSSQTQWLANLAAINSVEDVIQQSTSPGRGYEVNAGDDTVETFYSPKGDAAGVASCAGTLAKTLYTFTFFTFDQASRMLKAARSEDPEEGGVFTPALSSTDPLYAARDKFIAAVADGEQIVGYDGDNQSITVRWEGAAKQTMVSPVFPVSDSDGFEVYGSFSYGRGLTIASYAELIQSEGTAGAVIAGTGDTTSLQTLTAFEAFIAALAEGRTAEQSLLAAQAIGGELAKKDIERAIAAEGLVIEDGAIVSATPPTRDADSTSIAAKVSASPISSQDRGQSYLAANAPQELANIDPGTTEICQCKGAESMFFLQAFAGEYASLESNEAVQTFLENEAQLRLVPWELSREAMAGQVMDSQYTSWGERFQKMGSDYSALFSDAGAATAQVMEDIGQVGDDFIEDLTAAEELFDDL